MDLSFIKNIIDDGLTGVGDVICDGLMSFGDVVEDLAHGEIGNAFQDFGDGIIKNIDNVVNMAGNITDDVVDGIFSKTNLNKLDMLSDSVAEKLVDNALKKI